MRKLSTSTSVDIASVIIAVCALIAAIGQWLYPFPFKEPEEPLLPLVPVHKLTRRIFRMGDNEAASFPYITAPIQDEFNVARRSLLNASTDSGANRGILVLGESNVGKTRLAFEALTQTLSNWTVLIWRPDYTITQALSLEAVKGTNLVIFIDDMQEYAGTESGQTDFRFPAGDNRAATLKTLLNIVSTKARHFVIVATCRSEDEGQTRAKLGWLFEEVMVIRLLRIDIRDAKAAAIVTDFQKHGTIHTEDWDGTLGSLVLGLSRKRNQYEDLARHNNYAATVLRAMKLLSLAGIADCTKARIWGICTGVFGEEERDMARIPSWNSHLEPFCHYCY